MVEATAHLAQLANRGKQVLVEVLARSTRRTLVLPGLSSWKAQPRKRKYTWVSILDSTVITSLKTTSLKASELNTREVEIQQSFARNAVIFKYLAVISQVQITKQKVTLENNCYEG